MSYVLTFKLQKDEITTKNSFDIYFNLRKIGENCFIWWENSSFIIDVAYIEMNMMSPKLYTWNKSDLKTKIESRVSEISKGIGDIDDMARRNYIMNILKRL